MNMIDKWYIQQRKSQFNIILKSVQPLCIYKYKLSFQVVIKVQNVQACLFPSKTCTVARSHCKLHHSSQLMERLPLALYTIFFIWVYDWYCSCVYITHAEGTNQASNSLGNKTIEPIRYQLNKSEYFFVSSHLQILKSTKDNTLF